MEMETNIIKYIDFMNLLKIFTCNQMIYNSSYVEK